MYRSTIKKTCTSTRGVAILASMTRRELLQAMGLTAAGAFTPKELLTWDAHESTPQDPGLPTPKGIDYKPLDRPIRVLIAGYGNRGGYYGSFQSQLKSEFQVVGVADPVDYKRANATRIHNLDPKNVVTTWEHLFDRPKFADAVLVSTPDHLHYGPAMAALNAGYDLILEKPIAQTWRECSDILALARKKNAIVGVCHVLRYAPYFVQMKEVVRSGMIGDVVSIQHMEPIHYLHFAHSYVRGIWRNEKQSNPSLLAKSCHDLDILRWVIDAPCERVSSFGSLKYFRDEYAPKGAPTHCMDGCPIENSCIYHAAQVYVHKKLWGWGHIETSNRTDQGILEALRKGQYGKCVFKNDNTVVDHQVVNMQFAGNVTAAFSMEAMTSYGGRKTRIMGTKGDIVGDERFLDVYDFENRKAIRWDVNQAFGNLDGHGGGDIRLCKDFCHAVARRDETILTSNLTESMESHLIGFQAEKSRNSGGQVQTVKMPR
ncbi:hypothetical protein CCB80_04575 [Armatimonadetes bacterium Uphvl-Ar1]|nr:hypothetical protein CCB80_04575 [Armatimonadetes bacterium Uphvl-Ar1]